MADITFCVNAECPFKDCERHMSRIPDACIKGGGYVSVSDFDGVCKRYIAYLKEESVKITSWLQWVKLFKKIVCPNCKEEPVYASIEGYILTKRCPNCGAKMDLEE